MLGRLGSACPRTQIGVLGNEPGISPFRLAAAPTMFEVTMEPSTGSDVPVGEVVLRGSAA